MPNLIQRREKASGKASYRVRLKVKTSDGGEKWVTKTFAKLKDANAWLDEARGRKRRRQAVAPSAELLESFLKRWLTDIAAARVRENTLAQYRWNLEKYILPEIGTKSLANLTAGDIAAVYRGMRDKGLSDRSVRLTHSVLRKALKWAVADHLLLYNPADAVELARRRRTEKKAMSPDQAAAFLEAARSDHHAVLLTFLLLTGVRPSEAFAIQWSDIDLSEGTARVRRTLVRVKGSWRFAEPKTDAGRRLIPISKELVEMLRKHKALVSERKLAAGSKWEDHDLVFPGELGEPLDISAIRRRHFEKVCERAGLADVEKLPPAKKRGISGPEPKDRKRIRPWFSLYSLRHTAASLLARAGTHPRVAATILGHADTATTLEVYTHSAPDLERTATGALAQLVKFSPGVQEGTKRVPNGDSGQEKALRVEG